MTIRTLVAGVIAVIAASILLPGAEVQAAGEDYKWSNNLRSSLTVSGGNLRKMSVTGGTINLPQRSGFEGEYVSETVATPDGACDEYGATISVTVSNDEVTFVNAYCNSNSGEVLYTDWALGPVAPASPPGGGGPGQPSPPTDDPRIKDTKEEYSFVGTAGNVVKACKGVWYGFNPNGNGCVNFTYLEQGGTADVLTWIREDSPVTDDCGGPNAGNYILHINLTEPRTLQDDALAATIHQEQHGGCSNNMKDIGVGIGSAAAISITNAGQLESLAGIPVESEPEEPVSLCQVTGGLSWILCPIMNTVAEVNDLAFKFIEVFLRVPPMMTDGDNNGAYEVWKMIRNLANVLFAIVFIIIVYSQLTSAGISNYGVKKMLPKLLVGVILVNASFLLVALAVDLSNVVGATIYRVMDSMGQAAVVGDGEGFSWSWKDVTAAVLAGTSLTAAAVVIPVMLGFTVLFPLAVSAFFMIVGLMFVLTFRHAMVFILAVLAPLAIVAYLLPNTEGLFKSWFKMLRVLLYIYPAVGFIMGASNVAAAILFSVSQGLDDSDPSKPILMIIAVAMPAMAIFAALMLAKTMGSVAGKLGFTNPFGGMINAAKERAGAKGRNADGAISNNRLASRFGGIGQSRRLARDYKQQMADEKYGNHAKARVLTGKQGQKIFNSVGASQSKLNEVKAKAEITEMSTNEKLHVAAQISQLGVDASKQQLGDVTAQSILDDQSKSAANLAGGTMTGGSQRAIDFAQSRIDKRQDELVENARSRIGSAGVDDLFSQLSDTSRTVEERAAAARQITMTGGDQHVQEMVDYMAKNRGTDGNMKEIQILSASAAKQRKSAAWGNTDYANLARGELSEDKSYNKSMLSRLEAGKIGANELMTMGNDDRVRIAQLAKEHPAEMAKVMPQLQESIKELYTNENTKDRLTPEMIQAFTDIQTGTGPKTVTGGGKPLQHLEFDRPLKIPKSSTP